MAPLAPPLISLLHLKSMQWSRGFECGCWPIKGAFPCPHSRSACSCLAFSPWDMPSQERLRPTRLSNPRGSWRNATRCSRRRCTGSEGDVRSDPTPTSTWHRPNRRYRVTPSRIEGPAGGTLRSFVFVGFTGTYVLVIFASPITHPGFLFCKLFLATGKSDGSTVRKPTVRLAQSDSPWNLSVRRVCRVFPRTRFTGRTLEHITCSHSFRSERLNKVGSPRASAAGRRVPGTLFAIPRLTNNDRFY